MRRIAIALFAFALSPLAANAQGMLTADLNACPDATPEEASTFAEIDVDFPETPELVSPGSLSFVGAEARLAAHKLADFALIDTAWATFSTQLSAIQNQVVPLSPLTADPLPVGPETFALCFTSTDVGAFHFMPAVQVTSIDALPPGLTAVTLPAYTYAKFHYEGPRAGIGDFRYAVQTQFWPSRPDLVRADAPNIEVYPPNDDPASDTVSMDLLVALDLESGQ